jgi:ATP-dependent DNA ligase
MSLRERTRPGLGIIEPCLPSIKHDGFRILARRDGAGVRLITRHGNDFTARFPLACIVSKRLGSPYRSGRSPHWVKVKNPNAPAVRREAEADWGDQAGQTILSLPFFPGC